MSSSRRTGSVFSRAWNRIVHARADRWAYVLMQTDAADGEANIIFGAVLDESMRDEIKITVIATGFDTRSETLAVPSAAAAAAGAGMAGSRSPVISPDLEIPAFLRRAQK